MSAGEPVTLRIGVFGQPSQDDLEHVASATTELLSEITGSMFGDRDAIRWEVGDWRLKCDGCERTAPMDPRPDGWVHALGEDFCPLCAVCRATP